MTPLDLDRILGGLKDFQRETVEYVFRRLYLDDPPAHRFLVADEVGLGKTMVARGIIAKCIEHLRPDVPRVDIVYVCSNAAIASQNINRLNVTGDPNFAMATRLTLLPMELHKLKAKDGERKVNFISFTPGTTFDLKSSGGIKEERALLYDLLCGAGLEVSFTALRNLLQCGVGMENWKGLIAQDRKIDRDLAQKFHAALTQDSALTERLLEACGRFGRWREQLPESDSLLRNEVIGALRQALARVCIDALEPDLVILDEFQRFKDLLKGEDTEAARLAQSLMSYKDSTIGQQVRVLLLSATPYRMMTLDHEADDDHYTDFLDTLRFLFGEEAQVEAVTAGLSEFRKALYGIGSSEAEALRARDDVQDRLLKVMTRTERVGSTADLDAMVEELPVATELHVADLHHAQFVTDVARTVGAPDAIEYWKSSPYLLQFMKGYDLKRKFDDHMDDESVELGAKLLAGQRCWLTPEQIGRYEPVIFANARLRALANDVLESGLWRMLWMPPSLPYLQPQGAYAVRGEVSKALVFSSWNVVPDAIAALLSYEAERRMLGEEADKPEYAELSRKRRGLLRFTVDAEGRPTGMPALALMYPCATLATKVDPLALAVRLGGGKPAAEEQIRRHVVAKIEELLADAGLVDSGEGREDERWYWAALALLDRHHAPGMKEWCTRGWVEAGAGHEDEPGQGFVEHVTLFVQASRGLLQPELGRMPRDLPDVLTDLALAGPGICAARALRRIAPGLHMADPALASAAATLAGGLRTLFNLPDTLALLRGEGEGAPYWRRVLRHGIEGNLQAMLDEYAHVLREALGLVDHAAADVVREVAEEIAGALSLRTSRLDLDTFEVREGRAQRTPDPVHLRCRFALRFGEIKDDNGAQLARADVVRQAFNSPFRPFVLASTSVGQEGLDFHPYCHVLYHWNLPGNPVDMEQREGRVHRYKGHAVRKNVARRFGLAELRGRWNGDGDPWQVLFDRAKETRPAGASDLIPYWIYEVDGGAKVQRNVPMVPLSREHGQLARLKRSLAMYRLVFGQPRQQDLLGHLERRASAGDVVDVGKWRIMLTPHF